MGNETGRSIGASGAVYGQPLAAVFRDDALQRPLNVYSREILHEHYWFTEKVIGSLILHAPENIVWGCYRKGKLAAIIEQNVDVEVVVFRIALCQFRKIGNICDFHVATKSHPRRHDARFQARGAKSW